MTQYEYKEVSYLYNLEPGDDNPDFTSVMSRESAAGWRLAAVRGFDGGEVLYLERPVANPATEARARAAEHLLTLMESARLRSITHGRHSPEGEMHEVCLGWRTSGASRTFIDTLVRESLRCTGPAEKGE